MSQRLIVVIPTAGNCRLLPRTLESLGNCKLPAAYEGTIIVENGQPGAARDAVEDAPSQLNAQYVQVALANKSNALNVVFEQFDDDDLIYLTDDDVRFSPSVLVHFAESAKGLNKGHVFGGPLRIDSEGEPPQHWKPFLPGSMVGWEPTAVEFNPIKNFFLGANWAVFAGDVREAGGFDARFGPGSPMSATGQEWSMQMELRKRGARFVYLPKAIVWHHVDFCRYDSDFLVRRKYRGGVEAGIRAADRMKNKPRWQDYVKHPLVYARYRLWKHHLAAILCGLLRLKVSHLRHAMEAEHAKGILYSYPRTSRSTEEPAPDIHISSRN